MGKKQNPVPPPGTEDLQWLNRQQVATLLGMSEYTVRDWHQRRKYGFPRAITLSARLGHRWRAVDIKIFQQRLVRQQRAEETLGARKPIRMSS